MKIMERYILKQFLQSLVYCLMTFIFLYIVADLFNYIDEMMKNRLPVQTIFLYYGTFIPMIFVQIAPIAALLATIYTLSNLKRHNELTAMRASGVSLWKILRPLLFATALLSLVVFVINDRLVPELMPISTEIREERIRDIDQKGGEAVMENIAIFGAQNRIIYARSFNKEENSLSDIIIHQNDGDQNLIMKLSAERGYWRDGRWVFEDGTAYRLNKAGFIIESPMPFRRRVMDIEETPLDFTKKGKLPEFMNFRELKIYIANFSSGNSATSRRLLVDLYYKTSLPFVSLIVIFVAAPLALTSQRGGLLLSVGVSMLIGMAFYGVQAVSLAMGKAGTIPPLLSAWLANIIFLAAGMYAMAKCR